MLPKLVFPLKIEQVPKEECVAGGTRVAVGSGSKGACVTICHPPETRRTRGLRLKGFKGIQEWFGDGHQGSYDITGAGFKGIAGLSPESLARCGVLSDGAGGILRGPPA
jgi:hypothetical protein